MAFEKFADKTTKVSLHSLFKDFFPFVTLCSKGIVSGQQNGTIISSQKEIEGNQEIRKRKMSNCRKHKKKKHIIS